MKQIINGIFFPPKPEEVTQTQNVKKLAKSNGINLNRRESNELSVTIQQQHTLKLR
jgi:hypothetical protein